MRFECAPGLAMMAVGFGLGVVQLPSRAAELRGLERERWQKPKEVLAALELKKGDVVADIGSGIGYFTILLAQAVGVRGKVYAVDIDAKVLEHLKKRALKQNLNNIRTLLSREDDPLLPKGSVDLAFLCDTIHEIAGRVDFYRKVRQALKPNGRMAVIDWTPAPEETGKINNASFGHVSRDETVGEAKQAGFRLIREHKFLPDEYFLIFKPF